MISRLVKINEDLRVTEGAATTVARHHAVFARDGGNFRDQVDSVPREGVGMVGSILWWR